MAGVLWLVSCPPLPSDTDVFVDFVKHQTTEVDCTGLSLKTSSDREAIGSSEAFVRAFSLKNVHLEYKWDSRHYEGRPLAYLYGPMVLGSKPFPAEDEEMFSDRIKTMVNPPPGTLMVLVSQVVIDKAAEILGNAAGLALLVVRKEASDTRNVIFAASYGQFWRYNEKVRREKGDTGPLLPYIGPVGELADPVHCAKEAIMGALRDRVLDAADLPGLERHIQLEVGKVAFDLQSRYKLSLAALCDGYERLLQGIHSTNDELLDQMKLMRREQEWSIELLEKIDDLLKTGPGEPELHRNILELRKKLIAYEKNNQAVQDLAFGLFGKAKRQTIILHGIRKLPGSHDGLFELEVENTRKKVVNEVDIILVRGNFKHRLREPEKIEPGRKMLSVRIDTAGKAVIYASQELVKVSSNIELVVEESDVPVPMEPKKRLFPNPEDEKVLPPAPAELRETLETADKPLTSKESVGVRASAAMRDFGSGAKARKVQFLGGANPFGLGNREERLDRGKLQPLQQAKVAEVQRMLQGDFTPALRIELEELLQTPKGQSLSSTALLDLLIKL